MIFYRVKLVITQLNKNLTFFGCVGPLLQNFNLFVKGGTFCEKEFFSLHGSNDSAAASEIQKSPTAFD